VSLSHALARARAQASTPAATHSPTRRRHHTTATVPIRGRAEVMKLILAYKGVEWQDCASSLGDDRSGMKTNKDGIYPYRQSPSYQDDDALPPLSPTIAALPQSNAILRHLARQHDLYGAKGSLREAADVDVVLEGVESQRMSYIQLIYVKQLSEEAKKEYSALHLDKAAADNARNNGAHFAYLADYIAASGKDGWAVGAQATVADFALAELVGLHLRIFGDELRQGFPSLVAHHDKIMALPGVKEYVASPKCLPQINNNGLG
jgi:glutathione S-transferase